jgi:hypothetical protein
MDGILLCRFAYDLTAQPGATNFVSRHGHTAIASAAHIKQKIEEQYFFSDRRASSAYWNSNTPASMDF